MGLDVKCRRGVWRRRVVGFVLTVVVVIGTAGSVRGDYGAEIVWGAEITDGDLYAKSACLMDGDSGRVLYGKQSDVPLAMASTTKIMTCILTLEQADVNSVVTASARAAKAPKVHLGVKEGQEFVLGDLLYALMLESFNDAAVMIAEGTAGTVEEFAARMNEKAVEIGCKDTHFVTPNGLDATDEGGAHHTTAADLALIMRYCVSISPKAQEFLQITQMASYSFWDVGQTVFYNCNNHNAFLTMMDGALSGKTGFTAKAGYCYVGALQRDGKLFIVSLLACGWPNNKSYKWSDTRKLMTYGLENYNYRDIFKEGVLDTPVHVDHGQYTGPLGAEDCSCRLTYGENLEGIRKQILMREGEQVEVRADLPEKLEAPVAPGTEVGSVSYLLDGETIASYPVYTENSAEKIDFSWCMNRVFMLYCNKYKNEK